MQVYVELAVIENFCMDFTLLYCAKLTVKNRAGWARCALAASFGACFAVIFPLIPLGAAWSAVLKVASGLFICLTGGRFKSFVSYLKYTLAFFAYSAVLAGALFGIFALTGISYEEGGGYIYSSVPVGIPLFGALMLIIAARAVKNKFSKGEKKQVICRIFCGENSVEIAGFFDSGNKVYHRGVPVSVIPEGTARKLTDLSSIKDRVKIHTVAGSKSIGVFTADKMEIDFGDKKTAYTKVKIGVSYAHITDAVLHPDILEG